MTSDEATVNVICPSEDELLKYKLIATTQCPVCNKVIKNPSAMRMHMAQTHAVGTESVLQSYNKAFTRLNKVAKSLYACPSFNCNRTYGTGRYFKCLSTLREHYLCMHAEKKHVCQKCTATFGNPKRMELHMRTCQTMFYCSCGSPFKRRDALLEHSVKSQHNLPEDVKNELFRRSNGAMKDKSMPRNMSNISVAENCGNYTDTAPVGSLVILPQGIPAGQHIKSNAYLIITNPNSAFGKSAIRNHGSQPGLASSLKILPKSDNEPIMKDNNGNDSKGAQILVRHFDQSPALSECGVSNANFASQRKTLVCGNMPIEPESMTKSIAVEVEVASKVTPRSNVDKVADAADTEKLERLNRALKQYKPIKKKSPFDPVISDWHCIAPPRKYKRRKKNLDGKKIERASSNDDVSVMSMQHCLKKASSLVKSLLPRIRSPRRVPSPELDFNSFCMNGDQRDRNTGDKPDDVPSQQRAAEEVGEIPFQRLASSFAVPEDSKSDASLKESASQHSLASLKQLIMSSTSTREYRQHEDILQAGASNSEQQTSPTDFNLENLTPEILGFLRTSVDLTTQNRNIVMPATNEMNTQETQTPVNGGHTQISFDDGYPFLYHFDNNDIETQTESLSSFLADAFTQTNQQCSKLLPDKQFITLDKTGEHLQASESWINSRNNSSNHTQTDSINQLIADAFTQTRLGFDKSETSRSATHSIADNHTQTNLSFDNFMKSFNFGAEDDTLGSHLMPDFTDMCTQTNPDPRFDMRFDELLPPLSSHEPQNNSSNTPLNLSLNSSQTQTVLSFDDMFGNSVGGEDGNMNDSRGNSAAYTQTSIIDDIFPTDNFTQTRFSVYPK